MGIQEQEALARQLHAIWKEAYGHTETVKWEKEAPAFREAWIQVAQFVEARSNEPLATDANPITRIEPTQIVSGYDKPSDLDRELMRREMVEELRRKRSWDQDRFSNYTGIVPRELRDIDYPDHK